MNRRSFIQCYADSMKLFERYGMIHMGPWNAWRRAGSAAEATAILKQFEEANPHPRSTTTNC